MKKTTRHSAFTLVELLVVISIIGVLMALLLPALQKSRQSAQAVQCLAQLRQWGIAWQMYLDDFKGHLPPYHAADADAGGDVTKIWRSVVGQYLAGRQDVNYFIKMSCPTGKVARGEVQAAFSFAMPAHLKTVGVLNGPALHLPYPSRNAIQAEFYGRTSFNSTEVAGATTTSYFDYPQAGQPVGFGFWHSGVNHTLFLDMHVGTSRWEQFTQMDWRDAYSGYYPKNPTKYTAQ